jgi:hypothetical protein
MALGACMRKLIVVAIVVSLFGLGTVVAQQLSFDRLYPQNLFSQAREHCVRAWSSLDEFLYCSRKDSRSNLLLDAALGQLTFAKSCVKKIDSQKINLSSDDLIEFSRVVGTVADRSQRLIDDDSRDKINLLKKIILRLREGCEKIMGQSRDF